MDIKLDNGCGELAVRWLVDCDFEPEKKAALGITQKQLKIRTSQGDVIQDADGNATGAINIGADVNSLDILFTLP